MVVGLWFVVFRTQVAIATRYKKPFVQCAYDGLRPTAQLTNGSLASQTWQLDSVEGSHPSSERYNARL